MGQIVIHFIKTVEKEAIVTLDFVFVIVIFIWSGRIMKTDGVIWI